MEKYIYYGSLYSIYKDLLTKNNQNIFSLYYEENLTLQEIADNLGVSKSYAGNVIKKCEKKLDSLENTLKVYEMKNALNDILNENDIEKIKNKIKRII